jgi:hypothetical protein
VTRTASTRLASTLPALLNGPVEVGFNLGEGSIEHFPARNNYYVQSWLCVESRSGLVAPEQLPRQALHPISTNGRSQLSACGDTQSWVCARVWNNDDGHEACVDPNSLGIRALELGATANPLVRRQPPRRRHNQPSSATVKRFLPLARRRFSTIRPFLLDIRTLNPCAFLRRLVFG